MRIGVLKETKQNENRVAITPDGVRALRAAGHEVLIQRGAGVGSSITDALYKAAGAKICATPRAISTRSELILKVKEPLEREYNLFRPGQMIFTYFHFASSLPLTKAMIASGTTCIAYETVQAADGSLPLLAPMSEVAGKMAAQVAAYYLSKPPGKGLLVSSVAGAKPAKATVIGGGSVGAAAAGVLSAMGANVTLLEINDKKIKRLRKSLPDVSVIKSTQRNIRSCVAKSDVLIGAVLVPGLKAPVVVTRKMVASMEPGSVIVDVAIDQGGCVETSRPTTHLKPVFISEGVVHYCVTNMPAAYPKTSTYALTSATLPYVKILAKWGKTAFTKNKALLFGLNVHNGFLTNKAIAESFGLGYTPPLKLLRG